MKGSIIFIIALNVFAFSEITLKCDTTIVSHETNVICTTTYSSGKVEAIRKFINGKRDGLNQMWFENGLVKSRIMYKNGCIIDTAIQYYSNGRVQSITPYTNCKIHGLSKDYDSNGTMTCEENYENGRLIGTQKYWYPDGRLRKIKSLDSAGTYHGISGEYSENGKIIWEAKYVHGKSISSVEYFENGTLMFEETFMDDGKRIKNGKYFYSDGKCAGEIQNGNGSYVKCAPDIGCKKYCYENGIETAVEDFNQDK